MRHAVIAGMGIQGVAIAYAMNALGYDVTGIEVSDDNIKKADERLSKLAVPIKIAKGDAIDVLKNPGSGKVPDIVISSLPFRLNFQLAEKCIAHGVRYCDLGGNIDTANRINGMARLSASVPVMTDLGLAPGIANVIAELGYAKLGHADSVKMRVGGLMIEPKGTLKYGLTFAPIGLYNEYRDDCLVIKDGAKKVVEPLSDVERLQFDGIGELEAFNTSGGISHTLDSMLGRGVRECSYKTIRFPGHVELIRFLLFECKMGLETFSEAMVNACGFITEDQVLMAVEIADSASGRSWSKQWRILHDEEFTAMQKTTGLGAAAVAAIIGSGKLDGKRVVTYADVALPEFVENLNKLIPEIGLE